MGSQQIDLLKQIKNNFRDSGDFSHKHITIKDKNIDILYFSSLISEEKIIENFIPIATKLEGTYFQEYINNIKNFQTNDYQQAVKGLLSGHLGVFIEKKDEIILVNMSNPIHRSVEEPKSELVVRGSHSGFIENLTANIQILRTLLNDSRLVVHKQELGAKTKINIALVYREDIVNQEILTELKRRLSYMNLETDILINPGFIEEFIEDNPFTVFPQVLYTERPDRVGANIMDGRIAIMTEGSPAVLIVPATFFVFYQSPDDINSRWTTATFIRLLRMVSFVIAIIFPSIYIGVVSFHLEVLPNELIIPMQNAVEDIPYPPIIEAFIMELTIELIREAGIRLPTPISQTIGIVGGLVIGDAVVRAGLISNSMVVVVAITAISSFVVPSNELSAAVRLLRFPLMLIAATFGFVGIVFGFILILVNLCKLESFRVPYFYPFGPLRIRGLMDTIVRVPLWLMKERPQDTMPKKKRIISWVRGWDKNEK